MYNLGHGTMTRALEIANTTTGKPFNQLTFDDLTFGGEAPAFVTPLFMAMDTFRGSFIQETDPVSKLEARFFTAEDYPRKVLAIAGTNAP